MFFFLCRLMARRWLLMLGIFHSPRERSCYLDLAKNSTLPVLSTYPDSVLDSYWNRGHARHMSRQTSPLKQ